MAIDFDCSCGKHHTVENSRAGKYMLCVACHKKTRIPVCQTDEDSSVKSCPLCNAKVAEISALCPQCGYNFNSENPRNAPMIRPKKEDNPVPGTVDNATIRAICIGLGITLIIILLSLFGNFFLSLPATVLHCFATLCHEIGHSLFAWIFGCPSVPAFDFKYGGGIAITYDRSAFVMFIVYAAFAFSLWFSRNNRAALITIASLLAIHTLFAYTVLHQVLILLMGHGGELLFATMFLYRAWTGYSTFHEQERIAYSICGFFLALKNMIFSFKLFSSMQARVEYGQAKGGGHWMDFDRIAKYMHVDLSTVALLFCFCCVLPVVISYFLFRYERKLNEFLIVFSIKKGKIS